MCMLECVEQKVFSLGKDDIMKSPSQTKLNWFIESSFSSCWTWSMKNYVCHEIVRNYLLASFSVAPSSAVPTRTPRVS